MSHKFKGSVVPVKDDEFNPEWAAEMLYKAVKGLGTDEKAIIDILVSHSNHQLQTIKLQYKTAYGQDLEDDLSSDLSGDFKTAVLDRMCPLNLLNAHRLRKAMKGLGTDEDALIDILCSATNDQILEMKEMYSKEFGRSLEDDVASECRGHLKKILVSQIQANRDESMDIDEAKVQQDAQDLFDAGEGQWGTDESVFNRILSTRSFRHLRHVFETYKSLSEKTVLGAIEAETSGDLRKAFVSIAKFAQNRLVFYAEQFHAAMAGIGTDENSLTRLVLAHCEVDLAQIKQVFLTTYGKSLVDRIADDTSGYYRLLLCRLVSKSYAEA